MSIPAIPAALGGTVGGMFRDAALANPDGVALRAAGVELRYRELENQVNRLAHALCAQGVARGDRVAILAENSIAFVVIVLACARIGAMAACLNWRSTAADVQVCLALTTPRVLFVSRQFAHLMPAHGAHVVELDSGFAPLLAQQAAHAPEVEVASEDGLLILFTSGTTGKPKAAWISHRAMIARALLMRADWHILRTDGFIAWSPLSHMAAADPTLACLMQGSTVTLLPGFDPDGIVHALTQHPVGWLVLLPGMIERLAERTWRAREKTGRIPRTVVLKLKTAQFQILTRSLTPDFPPDSLHAFTRMALGLLDRVGLPADTRYRLAGVGLSGFGDDASSPQQSGLFGA